MNCSTLNLERSSFRVSSVLGMYYVLLIFLETLISSAVFKHQRQLSTYIYQKFYFVYFVQVVRFVTCVFTFTSAEYNSIFFPIWVSNIANLVSHFKISITMITTYFYLNFPSKNKTAMKNLIVLI